jgi:lantibiotic leader peptide-processing serine protease
MHRLRLTLSVLSALALAGCSADKPEPLSPLAPSTASHSVSASSAGRYILASNGKFASDLATRVAALGGTLERVHEAGGIAVVSGISDANAAKLSAIGGVNEVQPDAEFSLDAPLAAAEADASATQDPSVNSQLNPAAAALYSFQWNMRDIGADKAWAAGKLGSAGVTVAILDTGIDYDAPDLNGLVDLSRSTSFIPSDDAITHTYFPSRNVINDYHGHGTNVATQVSSKAVALAGVTSKTTLIGVKVLSARGSGSLSGVLNGVLYAADQGADVANMSLGGGFAKAGNGRYVSLINRVFNYAKQKGMLVVVAAGNDAADLDHNGNFLASYCDSAHVVCVSAVGPTTPTGNPDESSYYTNFGRSAISVAGPGGNGGPVISTWPWGLSNFSYVWSYCAKYRIASFTPTGVPVLTVCTAGNRLSGYAGTSQATPHVAGLAALLVAEKGHGQPSMIKNAIEKSADDLGQPGTDPFYGRGRINVAKAFGL